MYRSGKEQRRRRFPPPGRRLQVKQIPVNPHGTRSDRLLVWSNSGKDTRLLFVGHDWDVGGRHLTRDGGMTLSQPRYRYLAAVFIPGGAKSLRHRFLFFI